MPRGERRTEEILAAVGLANMADAYARTLSGGMRRRLLVAKALVHSPPILVLDEPTAGVDIELRQQLWTYVSGLNASGVTILLTTHYLEEAERLCDRIAIIDRGHVVADEDKATLLGRLDGKVLTVTVGQDLGSVPLALVQFRAELKDPRRLVFRYQPSPHQRRRHSGRPSRSESRGGRFGYRGSRSRGRFPAPDAPCTGRRSDRYDAMSEDGLGTDPPTVAAHTGRQSPAQKGPNQYAAFRHRDFRLFVAMRTLSNMAQLIQSVAVGWQVYDITRRPLDLGLVGLVLFLPQILLALPAGQAADRFPRKYLIITMLGLNVVASTLLLALTAMGNQDIGMILAILFLFGAGRTFVGPATMAILPAVVSRAELPNAITWNSSTWQAAVVMGPALGGLLYGFGAVVVYGAVVGLLMVALAAAAALRPAPQSPPGGSRGLRDLLAGVRFVRDHPILLGAISLDLFAVLFGGATALLPVFARDILSVGPVGLGLLRSAPAVGSVACALWLAGRPLRQRAGRSMFSAWPGSD